MMAIEIVLTVRDTANNTQAERYLTEELIERSNINIASVYLGEMISTIKALQGKTQHKPGDPK